MAFSRTIAAGMAMAWLLAAGPAAALTLTFQIHVTAQSEGAPPIDDFQMTWAFEPAFFPFQSTYYGDVAGIVETPQNAEMFAVAGLEGPFEPTNMLIDSSALVRNGFGTEKLVEFNQRFRQGDEATQRTSDYQTVIGAGSFAPVVDYTPGGFVYLVLSLGDLGWRQTAIQYVGGFDFGGPLREVVDNRSYSGTARLIAWDVEPQAPLPPGEPEIPPVPEPGVWALMILGFGVTGAALRRREVRAVA
jgi:hypothetical protein